MTTSAYCFISGVWKDNSERISDVLLQSNEYLRTVANAIINDNLDNSINMRLIK
jgi:hypothetical protein